MYVYFVAHFKVSFLTLYNNVSFSDFPWHPQSQLSDRLTDSDVRALLSDGRDFLRYGTAGEAE